MTNPESYMDLHAQQKRLGEMADEINAVRLLALNQAMPTADTSGIESRVDELDERTSIAIKATDKALDGFRKRIDALPISTRDDFTDVIKSIGEVLKTEIVTLRERIDKSEARSKTGLRDLNNTIIASQKALEQLANQHIESACYLLTKKSEFFLKGVSSE